MSSVHPSGFIILGWLTTSKGQICSAPKGQPVPVQLKVAKYSWLHISISTWQGFFCLKPSDIPSPSYNSSFSNWENTFVFFSYNNTFYLYSNLRSAQFSPPSSPWTPAIALVVIALLFSFLQIMELMLWEHKWLSKVTQVVIEVRTQTQIFWLWV